MCQGVTLLRIEEKSCSSRYLLKDAQKDLIKKINLHWMISCRAPFIIGIAIAGNIWTFHRITARDVVTYNEAPDSFVLKEWLRIDTNDMQGRIIAVKVAVHIASLLDFFTQIIRKPRTVPLGTKTKRNKRA